MVVTVIVAVPAPSAVTTPLLTVATLVSLLDQLTVFTVAFAGATVAVKVSVSPTERLAVDLFSVTPVTATGFT
jgi:hypothetical protein